MIGVIQSDRDEIPRSCDRRAKARRLRHFRQNCNVDVAEFRKCVRREVLAFQVRDERREITDRAVPINDTGLFSAGRAEPNKFHVCKKSPGLTQPCDENCF